MARLLWSLGWIAGCSGQTSPTEVVEVPVEEPAPREHPDPLSDELLVPVGARGGGVTVGEFQMAAARTPPDGPTLTLEQRKKIVDDLVEQELLFQEAFATGLYRDPKVRRAMVQQLLKYEVMSKVKSEELPDELLKAYYDAHKADFYFPEKAQVRRIFLRIDPKRSESDAMTLARDLRSKILADPAQFKVLAQEHSDDAYQRRGGDMGYVDRVPDSPHPPELMDRIFKVEIGRISEPFVAGGGVNLILVAARRDAMERPYEQVRGSVIRKLKSDRFESATAEYVDTLQQQIPVKVPTDEALAAVVVENKTGVDPSRALLVEPEHEEGEP